MTTIQHLPTSKRVYGIKCYKERSWPTFAFRIDTLFSLVAI